MNRSRRKTQAGHTDRKAAQLCKQVQQVLEYLVGDVLCDVEASVVVQDVRPAPFTSHLLVFLEVSDFPNPNVLSAIESIVQHRSGYLRTEIAHAIHRKKAPTLSFCVVPS